MTNTAHTSQCLTNAESLVTEELHLQGLWDATYVDGDDLRIPAWGMTVREVREMWLDEGTVTCRCDEDEPAANPALAMAEAQERDLAHAEALEEDAAHDAAVAAAQPLVPAGTPEPVRILAERLVQGVPMYGDRDLTAEPLTKDEAAQVGAAIDLASGWLRVAAPPVPTTLPPQLRRRDRLQRSRRLTVPPGAQT